MNKYEFENAMNGTMTIDDNDGQGDIGVTFWVKGEYIDDDGNGIWDICDNTNVVITPTLMLIQIGMMLPFWMVSSTMKSTMKQIITKVTVLQTTSIR